MARVEFDGFGIKGIRGALGNAVFRRYGDGTIISLRPEPSSKPPSEKQVAHRRRMALAAAYCRWALDDPALRPTYEALARAEGKPICGLAIRDFMNAPVVEEVDASAYAGAAGDVIAIAATDDTGVVRVDVRLTDGDGAVLEQGSAVLDETGRWLYEATVSAPPGTTVRITATAIDRPKQKGSKTAEILVPEPREMASASVPAAEEALAMDALRAFPTAEEASPTDRPPAASPQPVGRSEPDAVQDPEQDQVQGREDPEPCEQLIVPCEPVQVQGPDDPESDEHEDPESDEHEDPELDDHEVLGRDKVLERDDHVHPVAARAIDDALSGRVPAAALDRHAVEHGEYPPVSRRRSQSESRAAGRRPAPAADAALGDGRDQLVLSSAREPSPAERKRAGKIRPASAGPSRASPRSHKR